MRTAARNAFNEDMLLLHGWLKNCLRGLDALSVVMQISQDINDRAQLEDETLSGIKENKEVPLQTEE